MPDQRHVAAPLLETQRLRLRQFSADDLNHEHAMWCEPAVYKFIAGHPSTLEESWKGILTTIGHWQLLGYGYWAIDEKASGRFIGNMGFGNYHRDVVPDMNDTPEAGWMFLTARHRQGFGTEALAAVTAWGDANLPHAKTACIIAPENIASLRLAKKFGYREVASTTYKGDPTLLLQRDKTAHPHPPEITAI
jgi:RimJ/RimL family protein N-acetyltransferase